MGDFMSKIEKDKTGFRLHKCVEEAFANVGPYRNRPRRIFRFLWGIFDTFSAINKGGRISLPEFKKNGETVIFECVVNMGLSDKLLVISPPLRGNEMSSNVKPLIIMALNKGWNVAVHARERAKLFDEKSFKKCIEKARSITGTEVSKTCVVGLSIGAFEACKAEIPYPLVSISNGYDMKTAKKSWVNFFRCKFSKLISNNSENLTCIEELESRSIPTLLINSRNDPIVPIACINIGNNIATINHNVVSVTTCRGGHLGFTDYNGNRWVYDIATEFLKNVIQV
jgi:hypothetical protein